MRTGRERRYIIDEEINRDQILENFVKKLD
jgi:hypothetical protein